MPSIKRHAIIRDDVIHSLTGLDFCVYNAVLHNLDIFADMRVTDVARVAEVSNATVVRFCKKCGYNGFPDFKAAVLSNLQEELLSQKLVPIVDDMRTIARPEKLGALMRSVDEAFEIVRWADMLLVLGSGSSSGLALYGAHIFSELGFPSIPITSYPTFALPLADKDVVAIVISQDGGDPMVHATLSDLVAKGSKAIVITANPESQMARIADVCISYPISRDQATNAAHLESHIPVICALEQLGRLLYNERLDLSVRLG